MRTKPTPKTFSGRVERLAEVLQVSVRTLSVEVGLSHSGLSAAMRAEGCTMATLHELHARTGVDLNWLVCGEGDIGLVVLQKRPPPLTGAEFIDAIHQAIPDAFSDLDEPKA